MAIDQDCPGRPGHTWEPGKCMFRFPSSQYKKLYQREIRTDMERENPQIFSDNFVCLIFQLLREVYTTFLCDCEFVNFSCGSFNFCLTFSNPYFLGTYSVISVIPS